MTNIKHTKSLGRHIKKSFSKIFKKTRGLSLQKSVVFIWLGAIIFSGGIFLGKYLSEPPSPTALNVGQQTTIGNAVSVAVTHIYQDQELASKMHLPEDQRLIIIEASLTNQSSQDFTYLPSTHTYIRDIYGDTTTIFADVAQPALPAGPIKPGQTINGKLAFIIGLTNINRWVYFDLHYNNSLPILYAVSQEQL